MTLARKWTELEIILCNVIILRNKNTLCFLICRVKAKNDKKTEVTLMRNREKLDELDEEEGSQKYIFICIKMPK